jgi:hypothetical protein
VDSTGCAVQILAGSFFPSLLAPRRHIDVALYAVVTEAYVLGGLFADATYCKACVARRVVSQAVVIATRVSADGRREVLGSAVGDFESLDFRTDVLRGLRERGLARGTAGDLRPPPGPDERHRRGHGRRLMAEVPSSLCRRPDYADVEAEGVGGQRIRFGEVGIIRGLVARREPLLVGDSGPVGCRGVVRARARSLSSRSTCR